MQLRTCTTIVVEFHSFYLHRVLLHTFFALTITALYRQQSSLLYWDFIPYLLYYR